jgi:hypothetical protein
MNTARTMGQKHLSPFYLKAFEHHNTLSDVEIFSFKGFTEGIKKLRDALYLIVPFAKE